MLKQIEAWMLYCDKCGEIFESGDFTIFASDSQALEDAESYDWNVNANGKHLCPECDND